MGSEDNPSVFSFTHPVSGFSNLICLIILNWLPFGRLMHSANFVACMMIPFARYGFAPLPLNTTWFRWFEISQMARSWTFGPLKTWAKTQKILIPLKTWVKIQNLWSFENMSQSPKTLGPLKIWAKIHNLWSSENTSQSLKNHCSSENMS